MLRVLSSILSVMDKGKNFIILRTQVNKARPGQQLAGESLADVALVVEEFAGKGLDQGEHGCGIGHIVRSEFERDDLVEVIEHQVQLEAEESPHRGFASPGQAFEGLMADAPVVADPQGSGVNIVDAGPASQATEQKAQQRHEHTLERHETFVTGHVREYCRRTSPITT